MSINIKNICNQEQKLSFNFYLKIYNDHVFEILKDIEPERIEMIAKFKKSLIIFGPIFLISLYLFFINFIDIESSHNFVLRLICSLILFMLSSGGLLYYGGRGVEKRFKNSLKEKILPYLLEAFGDIIWTKPDLLQGMNDKSEFSNSEFNDSGLFPYNIVRSSPDDEFAGTYKGVHYRISETELYSDVDTIVFKGVIISLELNQEVKNRTIIATKRDFTKRQAVLCTIFANFIVCCILVKYWHTHLSYTIAAVIFIISIFSTLKSFDKDKEPLNKVELEDVVFTKRFNVYTSDQIEARCFITPLFMELLNNLRTGFGVKKLKCSFFKNNLMIAISTNKDIFEVGSMFRPYNNFKSLMTFYNELSSILKLIELFKLNEKIR